MRLLKSLDHFCNYCYISPVFQYAYKCCSLHVKCFGIPLLSVVDKGNILISACFNLILFLLYHCIGAHMSELLPVITIFFFFLLLSQVVTLSVGIASVPFSWIVQLVVY